MTLQLANKMASVVVDHPRDDTKIILKASMEQMYSIDAYADEGQRIIGKQGASITGGNGARLIVTVPEIQKLRIKQQLR